MKRDITPRYYTPGGRNVVCRQSGAPRRIASLTGSTIAAGRWETSCWVQYCNPFQRSGCALMQEMQMYSGVEYSNNLPTECGRE
jgi:hypothetical protein